MTTTSKYSCEGIATHRIMYFFVFDVIMKKVLFVEFRKCSDTKLLTNLQCYILERAEHPVQ